MADVAYRYSALPRMSSGSFAAAKRIARCGEPLACSDSSSYLRPCGGVTPQFSKVARHCT
ncbi:hypothetical protein SBV1_130026 [Verrucomicrobia bacterium]|nr:hypothetical protein SBV1_130026 [Verrucomicrobiota bacterium]